MVNINIEIPSELHRRVKISATINGATLKETIIRALEKRVRKEVEGVR